ncbi:hypothetical protein JZ751_006960, partial [Albula glossodonta]
QPDKLRVVWTRRNRRICSKLHGWQPGIQNSYRGMVIWQVPENVDITVTLFKETKGRRKVLASVDVNMRKYASATPSQVDLTLKLKPLSVKVVEATLKLSLSCFFLKEGKATDEDMQSLASLMSLKQSDIGNLEDFNDSDEEEDKKVGTGTRMVTSATAPLPPEERVHDLEWRPMPPFQLPVKLGEAIALALCLTPSSSHNPQCLSLLNPLPHSSLLPDPTVANSRRAHPRMPLLCQPLPVPTHLHCPKSSSLLVAQLHILLHAPVFGGLRVSPQHTPFRPLSAHPLLELRFPLSLARQKPLWLPYPGQTLSSPGQPACPLPPQQPAPTPDSCPVAALIPSLPQAADSAPPISSPSDSCHVAHPSEWRPQSAPSLVPTPLPMGASPPATVTPFPLHPMFEPVVHSKTPAFTMPVSMPPLTGGAQSESCPALSPNVQGPQNIPVTPAPSSLKLSSEPVSTVTPGPPTQPMLPLASDPAPPSVSPTELQRQLSTLVEEDDPSSTAQTVRESAPPVCISRPEDSCFPPRHAGSISIANTNQHLMSAPEKPFPTLETRTNERKQKEGPEFGFASKTPAAGFSKKPTSEGVPVVGRMVGDVDPVDIPPEFLSSFKVEPFPLAQSSHKDSEALWANVGCEPDRSYDSIEPEGESHSKYSILCADLAKAESQGLVEEQSNEQALDFASEWEVVEVEGLEEEQVQEEEVESVGIMGAIVGVFHRG